MSFPSCSRPTSIQYSTVRHQLEGPASPSPVSRPIYPTCGYSACPSRFLSLNRPPQTNESFWAIAAVLRDFQTSVDLRLLADRTVVEPPFPHLAFSSPYPCQPCCHCSTSLRSARDTRPPSYQYKLTPPPPKTHLRART
ncbi:hypothetical protein BJV78DRAFT_248229 [Lactifluus subvellereus]|nr:hypothetical protein BJV78DRAFT_248229 [Lactifluus subvellereus]